MRILVVQESDWLEKGPHQSHHLMERLSQRGHEIRVIDFEILWRKKATKRLISRRQIFSGIHKATDNGNVMVIRPTILRLPVFEYLSLILFHWKEIRIQMKEFKPDLIIGFGILNSLIAIRIAKQAKVPFVYYIIDELHLLVPQKYLRGIAKFVEKINMKNATFILAINDVLREYTIRMGAKKERNAVIRAGVNLDKFKMNETIRKDIRTKYGFDDDDIVLFFMGWLYDFSGLREITAELAKPQWQESKIKLLIIGAGDLLQELREIEKSMRNGKIIIENWKPYDEIPAYIFASDICILPALKNEIMMNIVPIKMYEYMAAGKPVIATRLPGLFREFGERNGVIYIERPEETLQAAIDLKLRNKISEMGARAYNFVKDNSWDNITNLFLKKLEEMNLTS